MVGAPHRSARPNLRQRPESDRSEDLHGRTAILGGHGLAAAAQTCMVSGCNWAAAAPPRRIGDILSCLHDAAVKARLAGPCENRLSDWSQAATSSCLGD